VKQSKNKTERRNVTLSLSNSLLYRAKLAAVKENKSLSEFMREALDDKMQRSSGYEQAKKRQLKMLEMNLDLGTKGQIQISREDLHERK
jgi:hypothetical protein